MAIVQWQLFCETENQNVGWYLQDTNPAPHTCPNNSAHVVDLSSVVELSNSAAPTPPARTSSGDTIVQTQFENTNVTLQIAKVKIAITNGFGAAKILVPGTFGTIGRLVAGGYGVLDSYDPDDFVLVWVEDTNRIICSLMGLPTDGSADATVQGMGVLPGGLAAFGAVPQYPIMGTYYDTSVPTENQGWYLWPLALGNNLPPVGEVEFEPLGYYGQVPAQFFLAISITRPNVQTGTFRADIEWGSQS